MSSSLKIASWNINSIRLRINLIQQLKDHQNPDIICLQETKCPDNLFPIKALKEMGFHHVAMSGQKGYHGVAIVSKLPLTNIEKLQFCGIKDTRHISADIAYKNQSLKIHSVYVPAGGDEPDPTINPKFAHKLNFLKEMEEKLNPIKNQFNLLMGDLNIAPYEQDVWSHKQLLKVVSHTPIETETFEKLRQKLQWTDIMRAHIPLEEKLYTWWSYRAKDWQKSNRGRRLDHIWTCKKLSPQAKNIHILQEARGWEKPSDHVPILIEFS